MNKIKAGDIIKYRHTDGSVHYVIVMEVYGDFIKCADANGGGIKKKKSSIMGMVDCQKLLLGIF